MNKKIFLIIVVTFLLSLSGFAQTPAKTPSQNVSPISEDALDVLTKTDEKWIEGKVVGVHDGDTCTVLDSSNTQHHIRFNGIDAPELKMDFGNKSKENLSNYIFGKTIKVHAEKKDKYNREVGVVFLNGKDINLQQIKDGFA